MQTKKNALDDFLGALLRGAAIVLGCNSTNLILINEKTQQIRVRIGTKAQSYPVLAEIEKILGESFEAVSFSIASAQDSMICQAWRDNAIRETSSLAELTGTVFPKNAIQEMQHLIGPHRFICVPAVSENKNYGVLLFEKPGEHPFSLQQRAVLLRYARRIGDILANNIVGQGQDLFSEPPSIENHLLQLTFGAPQPTLFLDPDFRITSCNDASQQLLRYSVEELREKPITSLFRDPNDILHILAGPSSNPIRPVSEDEAVVVRKDKTLCSTKVKAIPLADDNNTVVGFLVMIREAQAEGEDVSNRIILQERLATMGEMAAQLAHEIRNPLLSIAATLESLGREEMKEEHSKTVATVCKEIGRLDMILKDYLAIRHNLSLSDVVLADVIDDACRLATSTNQSAKRKCEVSIDRDLVIKADYDALKQLFLNLLLNAFEASHVGTSVNCHAIEGENDVSVVIKDNGPGLSASESECFRPFFTTKKNGTGLGLAVCNRIAKAHGGIIRLKNCEFGCESTVVLPCNAKTQT
ncbi:MAG: ATP-binding protein [Pseudomonadota bacterium]